ncbi:hypothetical protein MP228_012830 [Amoeboaphelidium protococcarum]|nr:hypothetical protein MP228_012830 [Amoeboaphelidium protococcarum]
MMRLLQVHFRQNQLPMFNKLPEYKLAHFHIPLSKTVAKMSQIFGVNQMESMHKLRSKFHFGDIIKGEHIVKEFEADLYSVSIPAPSAVVDPAQDERFTIESHPAVTTEVQRDKTLFVPCSLVASLRKAVLFPVASSNRSLSTDQKSSLTLQQTAASKSGMKRKSLEQLHARSKSSIQQSSCPGGHCPDDTLLEEYSDEDDEDVDIYDHQEEDLQLEVEEEADEPEVDQPRQNYQWLNDNNFPQLDIQDKLLKFFGVDRRVTNMSTSVGIRATDEHNALQNLVASSPQDLESVMLATDDYYHELHGRSRPNDRERVKDRWAQPRYCFTLEDCLLKSKDAAAKPNQWMPSHLDLSIQKYKFTILKVERRLIMDKAAQLLGLANFSHKSERQDNYLLGNWRNVKIWKEIPERTPFHPPIQKLLACLRHLGRIIATHEKGTSKHCYHDLQPVKRRRSGKLDKVTCHHCNQTINGDVQGGANVLRVGLTMSTNGGNFPKEQTR